MNVDPLAEKYYNINPYAYVANSPLIFKDPDGMRISPIYGTDGEFLGTDDQGFSGEVIFMDKKTFFLIGGYNNGTDNSKKGGISHETAMALGQTLSDVIGNDLPNDSFTKSEMNMINKAITHIVSQMEEVNISDLHNGATSASYWEMNKGRVFGQLANNAKTMFANARTRTDNNGKPIIEFNLAGDVLSGRDFTVHNIQNTMIHEYIGHYKKGIIGGNNKEHSRAIDIQRAHPTWQKTTESFKYGLNQIYRNMTGKYFDE